MGLPYLDINRNITTTWIKYLHTQAALRPGHTRKWHSDIHLHVSVKKTLQEDWGHTVVDICRASL